MKLGDYSVIVTGPQGVIMDSVIDLSGRREVRLALDDGFLQELLVITSICGGTVEGEMHRQVVRGDHALASAATGEGGGL